MDRNWQGLFVLRRWKTRRPAYVLLTSLVVLSAICLALMFEYRYYANQYQLENQLSADLEAKTKRNLQLGKDKNRKRYLEFATENR